MTLFEKLLRRYVPFKEIGWKAYNEEFTRYLLLKTGWGNIYLHQLFAPEWEPTYHDHPWCFLTILLRRGYDEKIGNKVYRRRVGQILYRPATFKHAVLTPYGTSWSLVFTGPKDRAWGYASCEA